MTGADHAQAISEWVAANSSACVELLERLAALDAPTGDVDLLERTADLLTAELDALGASVARHRTPAGSHLEAWLGPREGSAVLIVCHYDTVWPAGTAALRPLAHRTDKITGPGVFDMRGGLVAAITAMRGLHELGLIERPVRILLTADEEAGSQSSQGLIEQLGIGATAALIPEPCLPGGGLKTERRGVLTYRLEVSGREAHAGLDPKSGISAIRELISALERFDGLAKPDVGTQINVGLIGGGTRPNVVPGSAFAEIDIRVARLDEYHRILDSVAEATAAQSHPEAVLTLTKVQSRPPMERTPAIAAVAGRARELAKLLGISLAEGAAGGGSDGNFLAPLGTPVLDGLGPEGNGAHAVDEFIRPHSLEQRTALIALLTLML